MKPELKLNLLLKITFYYKYLKYKEHFFNLEIKTVLNLKIESYLGFCRSVKQKIRTASLNTDSQWSKQKACFAHATQVWLTVNHNNISVTSGE